MRQACKMIPSTVPTTMAARKTHVCHEGCTTGWLGSMYIGMYCTGRKKFTPKAMHSDP